ncbi:MAG TPA: ABC transporter substrate-binding protein [Candidatus Dormibacteraeota bacterium]|jgi:peptide/nickel transport system substrate-binding protein|nr:ABC transporter substrate-binding protein [Candidatus Dormibacteraeota bacterium]
MTWKYLQAIRSAARLTATLFLCFLSFSLSAFPQNSPGTKAEFLVTHDAIGQRGGRLVLSLRDEPKTLNPIIASDGPSGEVIRVMQADLIHINRSSQLTEPALAKSCKVSKDGLEYSIELRRGLQFSDGHPLDADDVLFTFRVYLDEAIHAPQRDLLIVGGKPIEVRKVDEYHLVFRLAKPYGVGDRLFDGLVILPRHILEKPYSEGKLPQFWSLSTSPGEWAGLGPFRLKQYVAGERIVLERNPYYWKTDAKGMRLPYLDEIVFLFVASADAQVLRFQSGETDVITRLSAENFSVLSRQARGYAMTDAGAGFEYNFLFFNLNETSAKTSPDAARRQTWFRDVRFRQAISTAIDRQAIVRLVYQGRGAALWGPVTPGNKRWANTEIKHLPRSLDRARELLRQAGFSWKNGAGSEQILVDQNGNPVEFSIMTNSSNANRTKMVTLISDDLKQLGIKAQVVLLEFRSVLDRVTQTKEYDACVLGLGSPDADPNVDINVWLSSGASHFWNPSQTHPATAWEAEIDKLMEQQLVAKSFEERKKSYDRVQQILDENQPYIFLAAPDILVGAKNSIGNFQPAVLEPYALWNVESLFLRNYSEAAGR